MEDAESGKRIADAQDVLAFLSSVMNGEIKDQFDLDAALTDRLKAAGLLAKRYGLLTEKVSLGDESGNEIKITVVKAVKSDAAT